MYRQNPLKNLTSVKIGVELETQAFDGYTWDELTRNNDGEEIDYYEVVEETFRESGVLDHWLRQMKMSDTDADFVADQWGKLLEGELPGMSVGLHGLSPERDIMYALASLLQDSDTFWGSVPDGLEMFVRSGGTAVRVPENTYSKRIRIRGIVQNAGWPRPNAVAISGGSHETRVRDGDQETLVEDISEVTDCDVWEKEESVEYFVKVALLDASIGCPEENTDVYVYLTRSDLRAILEGPVPMPSLRRIIDSLGIDIGTLDFFMGAAEALSEHDRVIQWVDSNHPESGSRGPAGDLLEDTKGMLAHTQNFTLGAVRDGTVSGPEFQFPCESCPGDTPERVKSALWLFFRDHEVLVDNGCSFHIHVSFREMAKQYDEFSQYLIIQYLVDHYNRIPQSVWNRASEQGDYYARGITTDRTQFVAYRGNTWEFRFFGNIDNYDDGEQAIDLAIDACRWAYHPQTQERFKKLRGRGREELNRISHTLFERLSNATT